MKNVSIRSWNEAHQMHSPISFRCLPAQFRKPHVCARLALPSAIWTWLLDRQIVANRDARASGDGYPSLLLRNRVKVPARRGSQRQPGPRIVKLVLYLARCPSSSGPDESRWPDSAKNGVPTSLHLALVSLRPVVVHPIPHSQYSVDPKLANMAYFVQNNEKKPPTREHPG